MFYFYFLFGFYRSIVLFVVTTENPERKCGNEDDKIFKEEKSIEISKSLGLIKNL